MAHISDPILRTVPSRGVFDILQFRIMKEYLGALAQRVIWKSPPPVVLSPEEQEILLAARKIDSELFIKVDMSDEDAKVNCDDALGTSSFEVLAESEPDLQVVKVPTKKYGDVEVSRGFLRDLGNKNRDLWKHRIGGSIKNPIEEEDRPALVEDLLENLVAEDRDHLKKVTLFGNQNLAIRIRHSLTGRFIMEKGVTPMFDPLTPCDIDIDKLNDGIVRVTCAYNGSIKKVAYPKGDAEILEEPIPFRGLASFRLGKSEEDDSSYVFARLGVDK